jgi:hypothetical protein
LDRNDQIVDPARDLSHCFQRLVNFDGSVFERLGRYESARAPDRTVAIFAAVGMTTLNGKARRLSAPGAVPARSRPPCRK